jgi:hypothetical protein
LIQRVSRFPTVQTTAARRLLTVIARGIGDPQAVISLILADEAKRKFWRNEPKPEETIAELNEFSACASD